MNDEFLRRLRKEPSPAFAARLKAKLDAQTPVRRISGLRLLLIGFLIGGSALAATFWVAKGRPPFFDPQSIVAREESVPEGSSAAAPLPSSSARNHSGSTPGWAPPGTGIARESTTRGLAAEEGASAAEEIDADSQSGRTGVGVLSSSGTPIGGTQAAPSRGPVRVAGPLLTHALTEKVSNKVNLAVTTQILDEESAFVELCAARLDIVIATRRVMTDDVQSCSPHKLATISEAKVGSVVIVLTAAKTSSLVKVSASDVFLALAARVPGEAPNQLIENRNVTWQQVNPQLELVNIAVFGPAPSSLLGKAVAALLLEPGCDTFPWIKALRNSDPEHYRRICHAIREDGVYTVVEENNVLVSQRLLSEPNAMALLSFGFYEQQRELLVGSRLNGAEPTMENISAGTYPLLRTIHVYARHERVDHIEAWRLQHEYLSMRAIGPSGYLTWQTGFIALDASQLPVRAQELDIRRMH